MGQNGRGLFCPAEFVAPKCAVPDGSLVAAAAVLVLVFVVHVSVVLVHVSDSGCIVIVAFSILVLH